MADRTCVGDGCEVPIGARSRTGLCRKCYRKRYYEQNREHELAGMKQWRADNYEYDRARWATYAEQRWGDARREREAELAERLAASDKQCSKCDELPTEPDLDLDAIEEGQLPLF